MPIFKSCSSALCLLLTWFLLEPPFGRRPDGSIYVRSEAPFTQWEKKQTFDDEKSCRQKQELDRLLARKMGEPFGKDTPTIVLKVLSSECVPSDDSRLR